MFTPILTSTLAYISTNLDDIFILMLLLAQVKDAAKRNLIAGHVLGVGLITAISMLGALGLQRIPLKYIGILGLIPIALGIKAWLVRDSDEVGTKDIGLLSMAMITLGNGADNIGVYIPLFTGFSSAERITAIFIFLGMTALWIFLANSLANYPKIKAILEKYKKIAVPVVFIALGIFIIWESGLLGQTAQLLPAQA